MNLKLPSDPVLADQATGWWPTHEADRRRMAENDVQRRRYFDQLHAEFTAKAASDALSEKERVKARDATMRRALAETTKRGPA